MKKLISLIMVIVMTLNCALFAYADNFKDENEFEQLIISEAEIYEIEKNYNANNYNDKVNCVKEICSNIGISEHFVQQMDESMLDTFIEAKEIVISTYSYIAPLSAPENNSNDAGENGKLYRLVGWIKKSSNQYTIFGTFVWNKLPTMRLKDILNLSIGSGSIQNNSQKAYMYFTSSDGNDVTKAYSSKNEAYIGSGYNCTFEIDLPNSAKSIEFYITYDVKSPDKYFTACAQYFHKYFSLTPSPSISEEELGIGVSPSICYSEYSVQCQGE